MSEYVGCEFCIHSCKDFKKEEPCTQCNADKEDYNMFESNKDFLKKYNELILKVEKLEKDNERLKEEAERYRYYASKCGYFR